MMASDRRLVCQRVQSPGELFTSRAVIIATKLECFVHANWETSAMMRGWAAC